MSATDGSRIRATSGHRRLTTSTIRAVRASFVADLAPNLENYTIVSYTRSSTAGSVQSLVGCNSSSAATNFLGQLSCAQIARNTAAGFGFYTVQNTTVSDPLSKLVQWQLINTTTWRASDSLTIKNIASYSQLHDTLRTSLFGTDWRILFPGGSIALPFTGVVPDPRAAIG